MDPRPLGVTTAVPRCNSRPRSSALRLVAACALYLSRALLCKHAWALWLCCANREILLVLNLQLRYAKARVLVGALSSTVHSLELVLALQLCRGIAGLGVSALPCKASKAT